MAPVNENLVDEQRPDGWSDSRLFSFVENSWGNSLATYERNPDLCRKLEQVEDLFERLQPHLERKRHESLVLPLLFGRAAGAFKASVILSLSMGTDAFGPIRSCLEHAAYAHVIYTNPAAEKIWLDSTLSDEGRKARRRTFEIKELKKSIAMHTPSAFPDAFERLYITALEFGAHPNPHGVFSQTRTDPATGQVSIDLLGEDATTTVHTLKACARSGLCAAILFCNVFPEEARAAGIHPYVTAAAEDL